MKDICCICGKEIPQDEVFEKVVLPTGKEICRCYPCYSSEVYASAHEYFINELAFTLHSFVEDNEMTEDLARDVLEYVIMGERDLIAEGDFSKTNAIELAHLIIEDCKEFFEDNEYIIDWLDEVADDLDDAAKSLKKDYTRRKDFRKYLEENRKKGRESCSYVYWNHLLRGLTDIKDENIDKSIFDNLEDE